MMNKYVLALTVSMMGTTLADSGQMDIELGFNALPGACHDTSTDSAAQGCIRTIWPLTMDVYEHWNNVDLTQRAADTFFAFDEEMMEEKATRLTHLGSLDAKCAPLYTKNENDSARFEFENTDDATEFFGVQTAACFSTIFDGVSQFPDIKTILNPGDLQTAYGYAICLAERQERCDPQAEIPPAALLLAQADEKPGYSEGLGGPFKEDILALEEACLAADLTQREARIACLITDAQAMLSVSDGARIALENTQKLADSSAKEEIQIGLNNIDLNCTQPLTSPVSGTFEEVIAPTLAKIDLCTQTLHFTLYGDALGFNLIAQQDLSRYDDNDVFIRSLKGIADASLTLISTQTSSRAAPSGLTFDIQ